MAAAARLSPKDFFTDQEWAPISARSYWGMGDSVKTLWAAFTALSTVPSSPWATRAIGL